MFRGILVIIWVSGVFIDHFFFWFWGYFGHFFRFLGYFGHCNRFWGYFSHFLGLGVF